MMDKIAKYILTHRRQINKAMQQLEKDINKEE